MKWEYTVIYLSPFELSDVNTLNEMGQVEWELVTIDNGLFYFKRMIGIELSQETIVGTHIDEMFSMADEAMSRLAKRKENG